MQAFVTPLSRAWSTPVTPATALLRLMAPARQTLAGASSIGGNHRPAVPPAWPEANSIQRGLQQCQQQTAAAVMGGRIKRIPVRVVAIAQSPDDHRFGQFAPLFGSALALAGSAAQRHGIARLAA